MAKSKPAARSTARNYTRERLTESKARKEARKARGRARTKLGLKVGDPRQVEHKRKLSKGGTNARSNLTTRSASKNSADNGKAGGRPRKGSKSRIKKQK